MAKRNPIAKALRTLRPQVVEDKRRKRRKRDIAKEAIDGLREYADHVKHGR